MRKQALRFGLLIITGSLFLNLVPHLPANAANADNFRAGRIIDDAIFTDINSFSATEVYNFLVNKDSDCLKNFKAAEPLGNNEYGSKVSAARVIWKSGQLFNINPRVLLVTLQKETSLITTSDCASWRYRTAMGFDCPDNGSCNPNYYGFSKQLYQAARHFRGYFNNDPDWFVPYTTGTHYIKYFPSSGCGGSNVNILTRATASLYSYTPYQPNKAALDNLYGSASGSGSECSTYGNRNFWRDYTDWFGSTTIPAYRSQLLGSGGDTYIKPGMRKQVWMVYKNTGSATWCGLDAPVSEYCPNGGNPPTVLAATDPLYRISPFNGMWDRPDRPLLNFTRVHSHATGNEIVGQKFVRPNQRAVFVFNMVGPMNLQSRTVYNEWFEPVKQHAATMRGRNRIRIETPYLKLSSAPHDEGVENNGNVRAGWEVYAYVKIKNTGNVVWYDHDSARPGVAHLMLQPARPTGRPSKFGANYATPGRVTSELKRVDKSNGSLASNQHTVQPGEIAVFSFSMVIPDNIKPGTYNEWLGLRFAGMPSLKIGGDTLLRIKVWP